MRLNFRALHQIGLFWMKLSLILAAVQLTGCVGGGKSEQDAQLSNIGIALAISSGNNQITAPNTSWAQPLTVRLSLNGVGIPLIPVTFANEPGSTTTVVNASVITDADGYARTTAVSPNITNVFSSVSATTPDGSKVTFTLETRSYPDSPAIALEDPVTGNANYTSQVLITASISTVATAQKWCLSELQVSRPVDGLAPCLGGIGPAAGWLTSKPTSFTLSASNGIKNLYLWVADQWNQVSINPANATIFLDTIAPGTPILTLSDVGSGSTTDTAAPITNLSVTNDGDASYWCTYAQMNADPAPTAPTRSDGCWDTNEPVTVTFSTLGLNKVYIWTKDMAENISPAAGTQVINFTTTDIDDPVFAISDPVTGSTSYARSSTVNVSISNDSVAAKWCISESQSSRPISSTLACTDGPGPFLGWLAARPTTFAFVAGDGAKTVNLWVANPLTNTNLNLVSDSITVDTVPPAIPIIDVTDPNTGLANFTNQSTVNLSITDDTDATSWCVIERASNASPPSLPAWNSGCWTGIRPTQVSLGAQGARRIYLYTKDIAHNVAPAPAVGMITYTTTPPSDPVLALRDVLTNSTSLSRDETVTAAVNSPAGTVRWCVSEAQSTRPATGTATCTDGVGPFDGWDTSAPTSFVLSPGNGAKTVYVWVADSANNVNATTSSAVITLDKTPPAQPTAVMSDPNSGSTTDTNQVIATLAVTGDTDAYRWCRILQDSAAAAPASPSLTDVCWVVARPTTVVIDQSGTRKLYLYTRDLAGNVGTAGIATITYSTASPTDPTVLIADSVTSLTTYAKQTALNLTISNDLDATKWCVSEAQSTRPNLGTSACTGGIGPSNGWSLARPTTWTASGGDAVKRVYVWTANAANSVNANSSSASLTLDTTLPGSPTVSLADPNTSSVTDTNQSLVTLDISGEDADVTAWCTFEQATAAAAPAAPAFGNACWSTTKPVTLTLTATGSRKVYVYLRDRAYNVSAAAAVATINYSTTASATATLALTDPATASASYVRQVAISASITGDTGAVKWCLSEAQTTAPALGTSNCLGGTGAANGWLTTRPTTFTLASTDGAKSVYLWTADVANNVSAVAVTDSVTLDTQTPAVPFVTISDPVTTSTSATNLNPPDMSIQYDTDAVAWCVIEQAVATAAPATPAWNSGCFVTPRPTQVTLGATGVRRIFVFTKDVAANVSPAPGTSQINYSTTPPADPSLALSNSTTNTTTVTKDLVVTTAISSPTGTIQWCLSQTQTTKPATGAANCVGGSGPTNGWYSSLPASFTLSSGDGLKTVYLWVSDNINNVNTNATTGSITLDTTPPATPTVVLSDPNTLSTTETNQFTVNLSITADTDAVKWCPIIQDSVAAAPSTPLLSDSCWRATRPTTQLIDATGTRSLYVFTRDEAGNVGSAGTTSITYSTVPPVDPTVTLTDSVTSLTDYAKQLNMTLGISGDTGAIRWCVSETQTSRPALGTSTCSGGLGPSSGWFLVRPTTFTLSAGEGLKRVYVWTADSVNNVNSNATSATITVDTTAPAAPAVSMTDPNTGSSTNTNQATVDVTIGATADALAWCPIEAAAAAAAPSAPAFGDACFVTVKPTTQALGATGNRKVYVYTRDRAYNVAASAAVATIAYSTTAPVTATLALSDPTTSSTSYARQVGISVAITGDTGAVKWCLSETQTTAPAMGTSTCNGGTGASNGWLTSRPTTFTLSVSDAAKTVYLWTADLANNVSSAAATDSITLDTVAPTIPTVAMSDPNTANTAFTNQSLVNLAITSDTDAVAWCVIEQAIATAAPSAPLFSNGCWVGARPTTVTLGAVGDRRIYVYTKDIASNISVASAVTSINYSTTSPNDPVLVLSNSVTGSRLYTADRNVAASINSPTGAVRWCISETQTTQPATGTTACTGGAGPSSGWYTTMPSTFQLSTGDALKTVYIWVADASNNTNANASSTTITLLETPPGTPTVALADPNTGSATNTNQSAVDMTITGDAGATAWCALAQDAALAAPATPAVSSTCWLLTRPTSIALGATGNRKVYVFLRDPAMNISPSGFAAIALSTTAPADPTLTLNDSVTGQDDYAKTQTMTITIASDATAVRWCVSESQSVRPTIGTSTCTGGTGPSSGWFTVRPTSFTVSAGDATKRVYVWVADVSNNVNDNAVSDTIILDQTAPTAFSVTGTTGSGDTVADIYLGTTLVPTLNWGAAAGASVYQVEIRDAAGAVVVCGQQTTAALVYTFAGCTLVDGTTYKAYVTAIDSALNTTNASNNAFAFSVSLTPPGAFNVSGVSGSQDTVADQWSGTSLPTTSWTASAGVYQYHVQVVANDGVTVMCTSQIKAAGVLSHDFSSTGCSAMANDTLYKVDIVAKDVAGNSQSATNNLFTFRTDLTSPSIAISSNPANHEILSTASFGFTAADTISGVTAVDCKLDGASYAACDTTSSTAYTSLADGAHTVSVRATDAVGLTQTTSYAWDIDTVNPGAFSITGATGPTDSVVDNELRNDNKMTANWTDSANEDSYEVSILNTDNSTACGPVTKAANSTSHYFSGCTLDTNLSYKIKVVAYRGYGTSYQPAVMPITCIADTLSGVITASSNTVASAGTVTLTMITYENSVQMTTGGLNPIFSIDSGTSTGSFGVVNYIGSGTYQVAFTGTTAGTAAVITATSGGPAFTSVTTASVTVTPGSPNAGTSSVDLSSSVVQANNSETSEISVTVRDVNSNLVTGSTVTASHAGGTSTGVIGTFVESGTGVYTTTFSGRTSGTATTITAVAGGVTITDTAAILVQPGPPVKIGATGPTALTTHLCTTAYTVTLRDYWNNLASAQSNVQIDFGGISTGNYSTSSDCSTTAANTTVYLGGSTAQPIYAVARTPAASTSLTFTDDAAALTAATITATVTGVPAWLGTTGGLAWATTTGMPSRANLEGFQGPRGVWVNTSTNYMYVSDTANHRIVRVDLTTHAITGWIGRVLITDTLAGTGCTALSSGAATPGWCTGGSSQASGGTNIDGMFNNPTDIVGDGTYLYVIDASNHRIVRITETTGAWAGWYGRVSGITGLGGAAGCSALVAGNPTPGWCTGGTSQSSAGATNWNGMFNAPSSLAYYNDTTDGKLLLVNDATNQRIVRLNVNHATLVNFDGWSGRILTVPTGNGVNYAGATACNALAVGAGTLGWCSGGTSQASPSVTPPVVSNFDNMYRTIRGITAVAGSNRLYIIDASNARFVKLDISAGVFTGWSGRVTNEFPATGGTNCGTYNVATGWCTGGVPIYSGYCFPTCPTNNAGQTYMVNALQIAVDGTYMYSTAGNEIRRATIANPELGTMWVGRLNATPSSGSGCSTTPLGFSTPNWCGGGSSRVGYNDGHFQSVGDFWVDTTNDRMYTADQTLNKIQIHVTSTGATAGWIGAKPTSSPTNWSISYSAGLVGNTGFPEDLSFGAGAGIAGAAGLAASTDGELYVSDTGNHRLKRYNMYTGGLLGWYGRTSILPTGGNDTCFSITANSVTPTWCLGGTSQAAGTAGTGELSSPRGLAVDTNYIYIAETGQSRVVRITRTGASFAGWLGRTGASPTGMSGFDALGNVNCPAAGTNVFPAAWCAGGNHATGTGNGALNAPYAIAVDEATSSLFVTDSSNHRISLYNSITGAFGGWLGRVNSIVGLGGGAGCAATGSGSSTPAWCTGGTPQGSAGTASFSGFSNPRGVAFANGLLFVADFSNHRIHKFTAATGAYGGWIGRVNSIVGLGGGAGCAATISGNPTPAWCTGGSSQVSGGASWNNMFNGPTGIWADSTHVYVVDTANERVTKHNISTGAFVGWRGMVGTSPTGGDTNCSTTLAGSVTPGWCTGGTSRAGRALGGFQSAIAITGDSNFIYLTDSLNNRIVALPK